MATAPVPKSGRPSETGILGPGRSTPSHKVTPVPIPKPGSIPSLPLSASHGAVAGVGATNNTAPAAPVASTAAQSGFGLLNPVETNLQDAASGSHRDGRIRNPVPSKLKGKTDGSKGNFSVLHMDVAGRSEATERDAQAKRTSESTELAAKRAYENGYVSLRRSRFVHVPDEPTETPPPKPFIPSVASQPAATSAPAHANETTVVRRSPLNSEETKSEQARLLTLLRSLHPVLVVDQICKALAFFGGIPGAPPPTDGSFPESAEANGSGSLFVGWIAEIFPKLGGNGSQPVPSPGRQLDAIETTKRRRGRPKGSKATKARKDKGIKKGPTKPNAASDQSHPAAAVDESWVDVDDGDDDDDDDRAEASENPDANVLLLAQASAMHPKSQPGIQQESQQRAQGVNSTPVRTALPGTSGNSEIHNDVNSSVKKRGRPKGSKNRPKDATQASSNAPATGSQVPQEIQDVQTSYMSSIQGPQGPQTTQSAQNPVANPSFTAVNSAVAATTPLKKKTGRPKGSTGKQKPAKISGTDGPGALADSTPTQAKPAPVPVPEPNKHLNQGQTYQTAQPAHLNLQTPGQAHQQPVNSAQKRKRKAAKETNAHIPGLNNETPSQALSTGRANGTGAATTISGNQSPQTVGPSALAPPPAKRPRKNQDPKSSAKKQADPLLGTSASARHQTTDTAGMASPVPPPALKASPAPAPAPAPAQVTDAVPVPTAGLGTVQMSTPISVEPTMPSISSPHHSHFEVQSPTIENYEAQLQAQLEQQTEVESQPLTTQSQVNSRHLMANRMHHHQHQQQQQQQQQHLQQRQQQMQQAQQVQQQVQQPSVSHTRSPNPQPQPQSQPQSKKSQTESPIVGQQQTRQHSHSQQYSQYRASNTQYNQQHNQTDQHEHKQQQIQQQQHQQQSYSSPQPSQQHFAPHQQTTSSVAGTSQQYSTSNQQAPQYTSGQQSYTSAQHQYPGGQQQRYQQQLGTSSGSTASYTAHQSPQFGTSASSNAGFSAADSNYRTTTSAMSNPSYVPQRSQSTTPSATAAYRAAGVHNLSHHSSSFGGSTGTGQHRSPSSSHPVSQSVQGMTSVGSFSAGTAADWGLFDTTNLEAAGNQGTLGLNNANYSMNPGNVRSQQSTGTSFSTNALTNFDPSGLGGNDRFYGVQRR